MSAGGVLLKPRSAALWLAVSSCAFGLVFMAKVDGQTTAPRAAATTSAQTHRAVLDQYCVTCHNDRLKTANLSLQGLDLATVGDHAELWEKVVRKLRAGVMPPPDVRRPSLA